MSAPIIKPEETCVVCIESPATLTNLGECSHRVLCKPCAVRVFQSPDGTKKSCPVCRAKIIGVMEGTRVISTPNSMLPYLHVISETQKTGLLGGIARPSKDLIRDKKIFLEFMGPTLQGLEQMIMQLKVNFDAPEPSKTLYVIDSAAALVADGEILPPIIMDTLCNIAATCNGILVDLKKGGTKRSVWFV